MRVMTLNMRYGSGSDKLGDPGYDLPSSSQKVKAVADAVRSVDPDIVALQEVRNQRQAENLASLTGMSCVYASHPLGYRLYFFEWGLAFLYRLELRETLGRSILIDRRTGVGRTGLLCRVAADETVITFINLHFDHDRKQTQMENLLRVLEELPPPVCLLGDFNCDPQDPLLEPLKNQMADTCLLADTPLSREASAAGTLVGNGGRRDYIWVDPERFSVHEAGLVAEPHRTVSDHIGYWADINL